MRKITIATLLSVSLFSCSLTPSDPVLLKIMNDETLTEQQKQDAIFERKGIMQYGFGFSKWPKHIKTAIKNREIVTGMTKAQVSASWGNPLRVFRNSYGDTWQYGGLFYYTKRGYLYFDKNDILTDWSIL
jgi:hypothetical protein